MVETRSGKRVTNGQGGRSSALLLVVSVFVGLLAVSASYVAFENIEHKVHGLYERGSYAFTPGGTTSKYWNSVPSWEDVKGYANVHTGQVLPEPSIWEKTKAFALRKPVRQVQAQSAYAAGKTNAQNAADYAKSTAQDASVQAGKAYDSAADYASEAKDQAQSVPDRVRQLLFGIKSKAQKESDRARRQAADAQWRAEHASKQGFWAKFQHVLTGPSNPSQKHWDDAKVAGSKAYDHAGNAASEAYQAAKDAAEGVVAGGKSGARSAQGAAAAAGDIGGRAADSASQTYDSTAESAKRAAGSAQEYAQAGYDSASDAAAAAKAKADAAYQHVASSDTQKWIDQQVQTAKDAAYNAATKAGLTAEEARHRAEEAATATKHRAQEAAHQATS